MHINLVEPSERMEDESVISSQDFHQERISGGCGTVYKLSKDCSLELSSEVVYL